MSQERPLRTAVAGLGDIGRKHAAILAADPRVELVALVDRDEQTLAAARADHAVPFGFDAVETLLMAHDVAAAELDALVVCLPTALTRRSPARRWSATCTCSARAPSPTRWRRR